LPLLQCFKVFLCVLGGFLSFLICRLPSTSLLSVRFIRCVNNLQCAQFLCQNCLTKHLTPGQLPNLLSFRCPCCTGQCCCCLETCDRPHAHCMIELGSSFSFLSLSLFLCEGFAYTARRNANGDNNESTRISKRVGLIPNEVFHFIVNFDFILFYITNLLFRSVLIIRNCLRVLRNAKPMTVLPTRRSFRLFPSLLTRIATQPRSSEQRPRWMWNPE
jgi:hypothetical protein